MCVCVYGDGGGGGGGGGGVGEGGRRRWEFRKGLLQVSYLSFCFCLFVCLSVGFN